MGKRSTRIGVYIILIVIGMMIIMLSFAGLSSNNENGSKYVEYESIQEYLQYNNLDLNIPGFMINYDGDTAVKLILGQIVEITSADFAYKASTFVNNNADPLALYKPCDVDNMYKVESKSTPCTYFRFRTGYEGLEHCTVVNWCNNNMAQGVIISSVITEDEALSWFGIRRDELTETTVAENNGIKTNKDEEENNNEQASSITIENIEMQRVAVANSFSIEIPKFKSKVLVIDGDGFTQYFFDKKLVFVIVYNDYDINADTFGGQSEYKISDNIIIEYVSENPFENGTDAYNDYYNFVNTIEGIRNTIEYL